MTNADAKPTPGPWVVGREAAIDYRPYHITGADGGSLVAWCAGGGPKRAIMGPEEGANARLIAAAPDMLEALRMAKETIRVWHGPNAWDIYDRASPEMKAINSAIAKAEGRSHDPQLRP